MIAQQHIDYLVVIFVRLSCGAGIKGKCDLSAISRTMINDKGTGRFSRYEGTETKDHKKKQ